MDSGRRALALEFLRFGAVGTTGFLVDTAVVYGVRGALGLYGAGLAAYVAAASWTWWLNRTWTFAGRGTGSAWRQWGRFMGANLAGFLLNRGAFMVLVTVSGLCREWPVVAVAVGSLLGMVVNFAASRRVVFR